MSHPWTKSRSLSPQFNISGVEYGPPLNGLTQEGESTRVSSLFTWPYDVNHYESLESR
jgi:hypothetical protein